MRKSHAVISTLLVLNLLTLPQFAAMAAEAESIRARVISSDLSKAFDDEGSSTELHTIVIINDIEHPAPIAESLTMNEQIASLSLQSSDLEEASSQEEIAAMQELISKQRAESRSRYIEQNTAFATKHIDTDDIIYISRYSPLIITSLNETEVNQLALKKEVTSIGLYEQIYTDVEEQEEASIAPMADISSTITDYRIAWTFI